MLASLIVACGIACAGARPPCVGTPCLGTADTVGIATAAAPGDSLPRRGALGAVLAPLPDSARGALRPNEGMWVVAVQPGSTAARAGLLPHDVIVAVNGAPVTDLAAGVAAVRAVRAGSRLALTVVSGGGRTTRAATMQERPRERGRAFVTHYDHVTVGGHRIRVMVTEPVDAGAPAPNARRPALVLLGGIGAYSVDGPLRAIPYGELLEGFAEHGWATVRIDKPGQGDSEGGPTLESGFDTELAIYGEVLRSLARYPFVDTARVVLFGHSMGGVYAPLLAAAPPAGAPRPARVAVYGTVAKTWTEYWLEALRRQLTLRGTPLAQVDSALRDMEPLSHYLVGEGLDPAQLRRQHPDLAPALDRWFPDGHTLSGLAFPFWRQLAAHRVADAWAKVDVPVLVLFGENDFVAARGDHELVAALVNEAHRGRATFRVLPGIDHGLSRTTSMQESLRAAGPGTFNPVVLDTLKAWLGDAGARSASR